MIDMKPGESRILGRYALYWNNFTDWFKATQKNKKRPEDTSTKTKTDEEKLKSVIEESSQVLAEAKSAFPFMLFPDQIIVDRHKLTIIYRKFFNAGQTVSVPIEDIKNIQADVGPMFGSLTITSDYFINNTQTVTCLPRRDVENIQKIVQGAVIAIKEDIDINNVKPQALKELLSKLGEGTIDRLKISET